MKFVFMFLIFFNFIFFVNENKTADLEQKYKGLGKKDKCTIETELACFGGDVSTCFQVFLRPMQNAGEVG